MRVSGLPTVIPTVKYANAVSGVNRQAKPETAGAINYKGHGMIERSAPSTSVAHVMAHERAHLAQYRSYANANDLEIIDQDVDVQLEFRDGRVVAVAGEAKATFRPREQGHAGTADFRTGPGAQRAQRGGPENFKGEGPQTPARAEWQKQEAEDELHDVKNARQTLLLSRMVEQTSEVVSHAVDQSARVAARIAYAAAGSA